MNGPSIQSGSCLLHTVATRHRLPMGSNSRLICARSGCSMWGRLNMSSRACSHQPITPQHQRAAVLLSHGSCMGIFSGYEGNGQFQCSTVPSPTDMPYSEPANPVIPTSQQTLSFLQALMHTKLALSSPISCYSPNQDAPCCCSTPSSSCTSSGVSPCMSQPACPAHQVVPQNLGPQAAVPQLPAGPQGW